MPRLSRGPRLPWLFAAVLAFGVWHLWHARFYEFFWDEDANLTIGWLLSKGWRLHRDVFTHHMAVEYMPSTLLAGLFGNRFVCFRAFMILLWAAVSTLVYLLTRRWAAGARPALIFAGLGSFWLTYWFGHMMLAESFWGYALLLALVLIGGPFGEGLEPQRRRAAAVGLLLALAASASLNCVLPCLCLGLWLACDPRWRARWRWLAAGAGGWTAVAALWCLRHADLSLLYDQSVRFNLTVYARYCGYGAGAPVLQVLWTAFASSARYFLDAFDFGGPSQYFESLLKLAVWAWIGSRLWRRQYGLAVWWLVFIPLLRVRGEAAVGSVPFHSAGYFLTASFLLCLELASVWNQTAGRPRLRWALSAAAVVLLAPTWLSSAVLVRPQRLYPHGDPECAAAIAAIGRMTGPQDRIAVFPMAPRIYFETGRMPAVPSAYYLPWQADWPSQHAGTLAALAANRPRVVVRQNEPVWGISWSAYAADIEAWLEREYAPVLLPGKTAEDPYAFLYVRKGR